MTPSSGKIPYLPEPLLGLEELALNFSWVWNRFCRELFREIDPTLWHLSGRNPIALLRKADPARLTQLSRDSRFMALYEQALAAASWNKSRNGTWFNQTFPHLEGKLVAYFCAEFGIHKSVPIYSGGLGVLAGDHAKAASDLGIPLVGVGLLYLKGYFDQHVNLEGWQEASEEPFDPALTPLEPVLTDEGERSLARLNLFGRTVHVGAWHMRVGRTSIYLLDTNLDENDPQDRDFTQKLYQGGHDHRLCQEWILGVGGVQVLRRLGLAPDVWHANEGHAAFMLVERVRERLAEGATLEEAVREVRNTAVFTTHTPVPAGHDVFTAHQIDQALGTSLAEMGLERRLFLSFGAHPHLPGHFHMTACGIRLSRYVNGVSQKHGQVTREAWKVLWPGRPVSRVPIGHITNGVHLSSWMSLKMMDLMDQHFGRDWIGRMHDPEVWRRVLDLDDAALWEAHMALKGFLLNFIREQARQRWRDEWREAVHLVGSGTLLSPNALTLGFARRFATYKRADLFFRDPDRLRRILTDPWRPVQIVFAGKAHPSDDEGKRMLQRVYGFTRDPSFEGRIAFVEDYDLNSADRILQGVDLWVNLPVPPMEASGTSGMKAGLNAIPQLSTLDGWWAEAFNGLNGWALPLPTGDSDPHGPDAQRLYELLEKEIVPLYYQRDSHGLPREWILRMKHALFEAGSRFTAARMVREYTSRYYAPAMEGVREGDDPPAPSPPIPD